MLFLIVFTLRFVLRSQNLNREPLSEHGFKLTYLSEFLIFFYGRKCVKKLRWSIFEWKNFSVKKNSSGRTPRQNVKNTSFCIIIQNLKRMIYMGSMCGSDSGHMGVWGAHEGVSWSKTIILSRHVFFEKSAIFDFFAILGRPKNWFFFQNVKNA